MDKFLIELLLKNNSVILPEFGAIVIANEKTGEVMFNEYLKFNDGKLIALIVNNSSMDEQDATNMVAKYIRDIQILLDKGDTYDIFGLGSFSKDKDGSTIFEGNINASTKKETEEIAGPSPTPTPTPTPTPDVSPSKIVEETPEEVDEEVVKPAIDLTTPMEKEVESSEVEAPIKQTKKSAPKVEKPKKVKPQKEKKEKKKRGVLYWIIIFLLVIVSVGGVFIGIKYDEVKAYMGWDKFGSQETVASVEDAKPSDVAQQTNDEDVYTEEETEPIESDLVEETSEIEETEEIDEEIEETVVAKPVAPVSTDGKPFHLIGGSFSDVANAEKFAADMKSKGLPAHIVGNFNGLNMVSVKSFSSRSEAMGEISTIQNEAPGAWLFKHPK